jgi:hypothetical protein
MSMLAGSACPCQPVSACHAIWAMAARANRATSALHRFYIGRTDRDKFRNELNVNNHSFMSGVVLSVVMLSVVMLSVVMLSVVMLSVVMLTVLC